MALPVHPEIGDFPTRRNFTLGLRQNHIERVLSEWAGELAVPIERGREVTVFAQDDDGVDVALSDGQRLRALYLVRCDGGRSNIRRALGIKYEGVFSQGQNVAVLFRSPLLKVIKHGPAVQYQIINAQINGAIAAVDGKELWRLNVRNVLQEQIDTLNAPENLRAALGPDIPFELLAVRPWTGHCVVADSYQQGRVFLAGDAAHLNWPAGGFGMNTGVGDAVDVGWKLAAVLQGWGGRNLLKSYTAERKVARWLH